MFTLFALSFAAITGCANTQRYEVVSPGNVRGEIPPNAGTIVSREKIDYEAFTAEGKVILRFVNRTGAPLTLSDQSTLTDAAGRQFVVEAQELAPDTSGRLVLPPANAAEKARPSAVVSEVRVGGIDEGGLIGTRRDVQQNESGLAIAGVGAPQPGFRWLPGQTARAHLLFTGANETSITHDWALRRVK